MLKEKFKDRYIILTICFLLMGVIIILRLVNLQIINGEEYDQQSQKRLLAETRLPAQRGNILDRNGVPIAVSRQGYEVRLSSTNLNQADRDEIFLKLAEILDENGDSYKNSLSGYLTFSPLDFGSKFKNNEYSLDKWKSEMAADPKDTVLMVDPQSIFDYLRRVKFKISDKYTDEQAYKIMVFRYELLIKGYIGINPIAADVSRETVAELEERYSEFEGVSAEAVPIRQYIDGEYAAHVVGFLGSISLDEYNRLKVDGYRFNDVIGKDGVEKAAEEYLRGTDGTKRVEKDINGRPMAEFEGKQVKPGSDVMLTLDMKLQKAAYESLVKNIEEAKTRTYQSNNYADAFAGAAVAIDVNTGEILAMASYPSYDPSVFLESSSNADAMKQINVWRNDNIGKPALNRAIMEIYAPGSTFKPLTAIAGLEEGVKTPTDPYYDPGYINVEGVHLQCLEARDYGIIHGSIALNRALAASCNIYFYQMGIDTGIDQINKWAKMFGLGERTGIELPGEVSGILASRNNKPKKDGPWGKVDTAKASIGQMQAYTPLQLANYVSIIANGGKKFTPHVIKKAIKYDGTTVPGSEYSGNYEQAPINMDNLNAVREGMIAVAQSSEGTANEVFKDLLPIRVAAKTGTAETGYSNQSSNALFISYAPADDPKIAVAVVMERGAWGSNAAPIAADILREYFKLNDNSVSDEVKYDVPVLTR